MMIESGHADYCLLRALSLMYEIEPDVKEARHVLNNASTAEVKVVDYFLMILDASAAGGENFDNAISSFIRFFRAQNLSTLWLDMVGWRTPYWIRARTFRWCRPMPDGLVLRTLRASKDTCQGDGRLHGFHWHAPGDDYEYS